MGGMATRAMVAAVASELPETAEKPAQDRTVAMANPPLYFPTQA